MEFYMGPSIQEWTKLNFGRQPSKNFTWSILEYFAPNKMRNSPKYYFAWINSVSTNVTDKRNVNLNLLSKRRRGRNFRDVCDLSKYHVCTYLHVSSFQFLSRTFLLYLRAHLICQSKKESTLAFLSDLTDGLQISLEFT